MKHIGHRVIILNTIITFPCLFICMSEQFTWIDIPDLDPMSQSFCTPPDPSLQSENFCQGNGGLNLDRRFYVHHTAEHIRTGCFMAVCLKIKEYCKNVFRGICKWMPAYERANIEVIIHVLHQSCSFSATLTVPLQTRSSKWPPRRRMHCSARALKLTLARLHNATAQTRRENDTNEVCDGIP